MRRAFTSKGFGIHQKDDIYDAIMYARMLRKIPTILEVLANWGYLEKYATEIIDELY